MNNKYRYKKFLHILLLSAILLIINFNVSNADTTNSSETNNVNIYSESAILIDSSTGQVLYEHSSTEKLFPASTTKLMTAILTLENCNLTDTVTVTKDSLSGIPSGYTTAALQPGETLTVEQLLHVLLIPSANDAANVLAFHIAGSLEDFSVMMNAKAKELGCTNTHFVNPSGIHNEEHYSTAKDMSLIGKYAVTFNKIREIVSQTSYSLPNLPNGKERNFKTTNTLITPNNKYYYEYSTGLKTGYTDKAKSCIVAMAKKDDIELICVVLGGDKTDDKQSERELDCHTLFDYGFNNYKYVDICNKNSSIDLSTISNIPTDLQNSTMVYEQDLHILTNKKNNLDNISTQVSWNNDATLPILKGTIIGSITYNIDNNFYTVNILAGEDILPVSADSVTYVFFILLGILLIILIVTLLNKKKNGRYHRKGRSSKEPKYFRHSFY